MRKLAITMALASTALAGPALARDNIWYAGVEGGLMKVKDINFDAEINVNGVETDFDNSVTIDHRRGIDLDLIAGYDFGLIRAEAEAGYKRASLDEIDFGTRRADADGSVRVYSAMINLLLDFGNEDGLSAYVGGGAGLANVRYKVAYALPGDVGSGNDSDRSIAFQGIAGVRKAITNNVDLGLKYRYFVAPKLDYKIELDGEISGKFKRTAAGEPDLQLCAAAPAAAGSGRSPAAPPPPPASRPAMMGR